MDLHSISKIVCRKRLVEIQQKVQNENKKLIKLGTQLHMLQSQLEAARSNYSELSASTEDTKNKLEAANKELYKEITSICENFKSNMVMIKNENEALTRDLDAKQRLLNLYFEELESYRQRVLDNGFKLDQISLELFKTNEESKNKNIIIEKLETEIRTLSETLSETLNGFTNYREETEQKLKSLAETIEAKCNEIEVHSSAATQANKQLQLEKDENLKLVVEIQNITASLEERGRELEVKTSALIEEKEARAKKESDLVNQKREFENEVDTLREQQRKKVFQLEAEMRAKEEEHSRELANFLKEETELEREKNALQDFINGLEQRIKSVVEVASKTQPPIFQPAPDEDAVDDWVLSYRRGSNLGDIKPEEDNMMLQAQSQADQLALSAVTRAELPPPAKRARPGRGTPMRRAVGQNGTPASNAATAGSKTTTKEQRFYKSKGSKKSK